MINGPTQRTQPRRATRRNLLRPLDQLKVLLDTCHSSSPPLGVAGTLPFALLQTKQPANLPIMQEPPVMTKDAFDEREQMFVRLGPSATELRHDLQSLQLRADMSAFKVANPGCIFEDFIRWYSPRDWTSGEGWPSPSLDKGRR